MQTESETDNVALYDCVENKCVDQWPFVNLSGAESPVQWYSRSKVMRVEFQTDWRVTWKGFYADIYVVPLETTTPTPTTTSYF